MSVRLQSLGVAAAPELDAPSVMADAQLAERGAWFTVDQPCVGEVTNTHMPIHFSGAPPRRPLRHAAVLGEDNHQLLSEVAGLSPAEIAELEDAGIVATEPPE